jgi:cytochrome c peroxidase
MLGAENSMIDLSRQLLMALGVGFACACGATEPTPPNRADDLRAEFDPAPLGDTPYPTSNPPHSARIELGRLLFFDPILGGERDVACGTCHHPDFAFADARQFAAGVSGSGLGPNRTLSVSAISGDPIDVVPRNTPTILNTALVGDATGAPSASGAMFWDGRAEGLEGQVLVPIAARREMRGDAYSADVAVDSVLARLRGYSEYVSRFLMAFPEEAAGLTGPDEEIVDSSTLARALAAYERELVTGASPFDRYARGDDEALSDEQLDGFELFFTKGKCFVCHNGPMLSNFAFMVTGVPQEGPGQPTVPGDDLGRAEHTGNASDRYAFRVPSLRNAALTAPYMHDGVFETLEEVVGFYNDGARPRHEAVTEDLLEVALRVPLGLTDQEIAALVAFLESLTDPTEDLDQMLRTVPSSVPSGLTPVYGVRTP